MAGKNIASSPKKTNSILDLAAYLKLSPATVSRALGSNSDIVKEHTRKRVLEGAEKLGYKRNALASGLRSNKTNTIGLIVPRISMFFHAAVITEIQKQLHQHKYNLIICQSNDDLLLEKELTNILYASRVDAVIAACTLYTTNFKHFETLVNNGMPLVFYDRVPQKKFAARIVKGDDFKGGYLAGNHLAESGCKRIAYMSGLQTCNLYKDRYAGFKKALSKHGLTLKPEWVIEQELTAENARTGLEKIFSKKNKPDGLFTANDTSAIAAIEFARKMKIAVPRDLKIIGYSNDPRTAIISPSITTIEQFPGIVAAKVVEQVLSALHADKLTIAATSKIITPVELIKRISA